MLGLSLGWATPTHTRRSMSCPRCHVFMPQISLRGCSLQMGDKQDLKCPGDSEKQRGCGPNPCHLSSMLAPPAPRGHMCEGLSRAPGRTSEEPEEPRPTAGPRQADAECGGHACLLVSSYIPFRLTRSLRHEGGTLLSSEPSAG